MLSRITKRIADASLGLVLPKVCFACGAGLPQPSESTVGLCSDCDSDLKLFEGPCCQRCAAPLIVVDGDTALACHRCGKERLGFDAAIATGEYEGLLRNLALRAKRASEESLALGLGRLMWRRAESALVGEAPDAVAAVPMHWRRRLVRQTNSPELMAEVIAGGLGAPLATRLLRRVRATRPQPSIARSQRLPNVRRAFEVWRGYGVAGATIVLVDDILTTGATCGEAARALKRAGAARVIVVVAAKSL